MNQKRPTSIQRIGRGVMAGVFIAIPVLMFAPSLIVTYDNSALSTGDTVQLDTVRYGGGAFDVERIEGEKVTITNRETGATVTVHKSRVKEIP